MAAIPVGAPDDAVAALRESTPFGEVPGPLLACIVAIEITRQHFAVECVSVLDVANTDAQVATTTSHIPLLEASARQAIYTLSVLLARPPAALLQELLERNHSPSPHLQWARLCNSIPRDKPTS